MPQIQKGWEKMSGKEIVRISPKQVYEIGIATQSRGKKGERVRTKLVDTATKILLGDDKDVARFYELVRKGGIIETEVSKVYKLAEEFNVADKEKFLASVIVSKAETFSLPSGDAKCGEIEVTTWGENLLDDPKYSPVNEFVAIYIDNVKFRQRTEDGEVEIKEGKYIRIEPPSHKNGAVVLPVNREKKEVLLVTQYRHPQRQFLTEAPRGFGILGIDDEDIDTARRELAEETGALPIKEEGVEALYHLRALYTDTGKLWEAPSYFLAFVDRKLQMEKLNRFEPTMEDPVWVSLKAFYKAIYWREVKLRAGKYELCLKPEYRKKLNAHTPIDDGVLEIKDAFTCLAGLLALPHLMAEGLVSKTLLSEIYKKPKIC
jgi:8-oxo-dGTP pyrophosphatase MutT (NUDIX family)